MDRDFNTQLAELLAMLPDLVNLTPEQDHDVLALYTVAYKLLHGVDPPCGVGYEPQMDIK